MPAVLWTKYWLYAQGYYAFEKIVYQDNKIAIILENNGNYSSSKDIKHINIRCYYVTYHIENDELSLEWCPTVNMIGDFITKSTQDATFKRFRDQSMGITEVQKPNPGKPKRSLRSNKLAWSKGL